MPDDIDALAAAAYAFGEDPIDVAVSGVAMLIEVRDMVLKGRQENPSSFPGSGPMDESVIGRRILASLLDAGWRPLSDAEVEVAANRSRERGARFEAWLGGLSPERRTRALDHYLKNGDFRHDSDHQAEYAGRRAEG